MKYLKLFKEANELNYENFFKDKIDWKLFRYMQGCLTEYWDNNVPLYLWIFVSENESSSYDPEDSTIYESNSEAEGYVDLTEKKWKGIIEKYLDFRMIAYCISFGMSMTQEEKDVIVDKIKGKLELKYHINYIKIFLLDSIYFVKYSQKVK